MYDHSREHDIQNKLCYKTGKMKNYSRKTREIIKVAIISIEIHRRCQKPNGKAMVPICIARIVWSHVLETNDQLLA